MIPSPSELVAQLMADESVTLSPSAEAGDAVLLRDDEGRWAIFSYGADGDATLNIFEPRPGSHAV
jgi:hypothetical protein